MKKILEKEGRKGGGGEEGERERKEKSGEYTPAKQQQEFLKSETEGSQTVEAA